MLASSKELASKQGLTPQEKNRGAYAAPLRRARVPGSQHGAQHLRTLGRSLALPRDGSPTRNPIFANRSSPQIVKRFRTLGGAELAISSCKKCSETRP